MPIPFLSFSHLPDTQKIICLFRRGFFSFCRTKCLSCIISNALESSYRVSVWDNSFSVILDIDSFAVQPRSGIFLAQKIPNRRKEIAFNSSIGLWVVETLCTFGESLYHCSLKHKGLILLPPPYAIHEKIPKQEIQCLIKKIFCYFSCVISMRDLVSNL